MRRGGHTPRWPKRLPILSEDQQRIREDFYRHWLQILPRRFGLVERFNHRYPLRTLTAGAKTLEIGAGLGSHLQFESSTNQEYVALELRPELAKAIQGSYPAVRVMVGDCQERMDFPDACFDRILAIHILEHLPDLPKALDEVRRVLRPGGSFAVLIPCEGGLAYRLARNLSARRIFEKRYNQSYDWFVASEHVNRPAEILSELRSRFRIIHRTYFPLRVPVMNLNLVIGLTLKPLR